MRGPNAGLDMRAGSRGKHKHSQSPMCRMQRAGQRVASARIGKYRRLRRARGRYFDPGAITTLGGPASSRIQICLYPRKQVSVCGGRGTPN